MAVVLGRVSPITAVGHYYSDGVPRVQERSPLATPRTSPPRRRQHQHRHQHHHHHPNSDTRRCRLLPEVADQRRPRHGKKSQSKEGRPIGSQPPRLCMHCERVLVSVESACPCATSRPVGGVYSDVSVSMTTAVKQQQHQQGGHRHVDDVAFCPSQVGKRHLACLRWRDKVRMGKARGILRSGVFTSPSTTGWNNHHASKVAHWSMTGRGTRHVTQVRFQPNFRPDPGQPVSQLGVPRKQRRS
jgi:hypothetical protein